MNPVENNISINSLTTVKCNYSIQLSSNSFSVQLSNIRTELDSHADTCTVGNNAFITHIHEINGIPKKVNVHAFDTTLGSVKDIQVVNADVAYDCPHTGAVLIFKINQAIHIPTMQHNLLCVMQMRLNDVRIKECPKFLTENPTIASHSVVIPSTEEGTDILIPLSLKGVTSYFPTRKPTLSEIELADSEDRSYELTYDNPDWDPHDKSFSKQEEAAKRTLDDSERELYSFTSKTELSQDKDPMSLSLSAITVYNRVSQCSSILCDISPTLCEDSFLQSLKDNVHIAFTSTKASTKATAESLA